MSWGGFLCVQKSRTCGGVRLRYRKSSINQNSFGISRIKVLTVVQLIK